MSEQKVPNLPRVALDLESRKIFFSVAHDYQKENQEIMVIMHSMVLTYCKHRIQGTLNKILAIITMLLLLTYFFTREEKCSSLSLISLQLGQRTPRCVHVTPGSDSDRTRPRWVAPMALEGFPEWGLAGTRRCWQNKWFSLLSKVNVAPGSSD